MRPLRFRAFDKETSEMIYPNSYEGAAEIADALEVLMRGGSDEWTERVEIMQSTGLSDSQGVEIFEGDICEMVILSNERKVNPREALTVIIEWRNASWGWFPTHPECHVEEDRNWCSFWDSDNQEMWSEEYFTVVGNRFQNPDLLKEGEDE